MRTQSGEQHIHEATRDFGNYFIKIGGQIQNVQQASQWRDNGLVGRKRQQFPFPRAILLSPEVVYAFEAAALYCAIGSWIFHPRIKSQSGRSSSTNDSGKKNPRFAFG
jgi:hypothetical protein